MTLAQFSQRGRGSFQSGRPIAHAAAQQAGKNAAQEVSARSESQTGAQIALVAGKSSLPPHFRRPPSATMLKGRFANAEGSGPTSKPIGLPHTAGVFLTDILSQNRKAEQLSIKSCASWALDSSTQPSSSISPATTPSNIERVLES